MKLQSSSQLEKTRIYLSDLISFLLYLVISLSIVNDLWFSLACSEGIAKVQTIFEPANFSLQFFKKFVIFPEHLYKLQSRPTISTASTKLSTYIANTVRAIQQKNRSYIWAVNLNGTAKLPVIQLRTQDASEPLLIGVTRAGDWQNFIKIWFGSGNGRGEESL